MPKCERTLFPGFVRRLGPCLRLCRLVLIGFVGFSNIAGAPPAHGSSDKEAWVLPEGAVLLAGAARGAGGISLSPSMLRIELQAIAEAPASSAQLRQLPAGRRLFLLLDDLHSDVQPGIFYDLYLGLAAGVRPAPDDPHYVGSINFFGVDGAGAARQSSFDVTDLVQGGLAGGARSLPALSIIPQDPPKAGAMPVISRIGLISF